MAYLWDTVFANVGESEMSVIGDWPVADPAVELDNQGGLQNLDELQTAIIDALFTDGKLPEHMVDGFNFTESDVFEWHGNTFGIEEGEEVLGSLLWTIERMVLNENTARLAEHFAYAALQTLVKQHKVTLFDVSSDIDKPAGRLRIFIVAHSADALPRSFFADLWPLR